MEKEENVYVMAKGTEDTAECRNCVEDTAEKNASAVPDKFKDVDALARAYTALQAEFTRRSQRLKELERQLENLDTEGRSGVEKLRKNARARKEESKRFEHFLAETEKRNAGEISTVEEPINGQPSNGAEVENGNTMYAMNTLPNMEESVAKGEEIGEKASIDKAGVEEVKPDVAFGNAQMQGGVQASVAASERAVTDSQTLYAQVCHDENVRLKIIGEYLASLGKSGAPLMRGGVGTLTTPPKKATSISEAGDMALLYLKKPAER